MNWLYYLSVSILGLSEHEFWGSTPKKLYKLAEIHVKVNSPKKEGEVKKQEKHKNMTWYKVLD